MLALSAGETRVNLMWAADISWLLTHFVKFLVVEKLDTSSRRHAGHWRGVGNRCAFAAMVLFFGKEEQSHAITPGQSWMISASFGVLCSNQLCFLYERMPRYVLDCSYA